MKNWTAIAFAVSLSVLIVVPHQVPAQSAEGARKIVTRVSPQYPSVAHRMGLQGNVKVEVVVEPNGSVKSVEVRGGHPMLADAALSAVCQWKWEPGPHETHEIIEIKFTI
jgi:TonB family protein